ncbi:growth-regulating factor 4 isoform X2 [Amborella trichopoda]|nr:growth-regulating factor 4 isoform X2 [Amborella trichopoda]XP_020527416.1 growth-regulating factor 4 isoform X2 [Amborella trichopoda]|eukprot:XP_020527414.1 growth-regulating factor 4 isoform X2 [Amborella trichopoda]
MGQVSRSPFNMAQWHELEQQALIFKYMMAGAPVPLDLVLPIRSSVLGLPSFYHPYHHYQPSILQFGRSIDAEPGRCRRTDGKKWRCSREVVNGHKYCERHMHRGRNRSRKPVETVANATASTTATSTIPNNVTASNSNGNISNNPPSKPFTLSPSNSNPLHQPRYASGQNSGSWLPENSFSGREPAGKADGQILRHFFDDWPRSSGHQNPTNPNTDSSSSTHLTISIRASANPSSDFSLKLSTGDSLLPSNNENGNRPTENWMVWESPLAEALRSSTSTPTPSDQIKGGSLWNSTNSLSTTTNSNSCSNRNGASMPNSTATTPTSTRVESSPTSVLHKPYGSISETSSAST